MEEEDEELIQAKRVGGVTPEVTPTINSGIQSLHGGGTPLSRSARSFFEPRFGVNLSKVRLHNNTQAANLARSVNARAFTFGHNVVFGAGEYSPDASSGRKVLAHELTHVMQQNGGLTLFSVNETSANIIPNSHKISNVFPKFTNIAAVNKSFIQRDLFDDFVGLVAGNDAQRVISNLRRSVQMAPRFFYDVFVGEVLDSVREHWLAFLGVTIGLIATEALISVLAASPTGISQLIAGILQALVIVVLGCLAGVEISGAVQEGMNWFRLCMEADNDEQALEQASHSFLRMLRHIMLAILLLVGVRARVRGAGAIAEASAARTRASARQRPLPPGEPPPGVTRIHPSSGSPSGSGTGTGVGGPSASSASEGSLALARTAPVTEPTPVTTPTPVSVPQATPSPGSIPNIGPRASVPVTPIDVASAIGAGISSSTALVTATETQPEEQQADCGVLPISWPTELPLPADTADLVRVNAGLREAEGIDDGTREQRALAQEIQIARQVPALHSPQPPSRICFEYDPVHHYDAHHIEPRFLGGGDYRNNLCALNTQRHMAGHWRLNDQNAWIDTYQQCGITSGTLTRHPLLTEYFIAGGK